MPAVRAVSFDLWDTVFIDESDEPKRKAQGLAPKPIARRDLVAAALPGVDRALVECAYDTADAAFRQVWFDQHVTWSVADRLRVVLAGLGQELPRSAFDALVRDHEEMELKISPDLVPGVVEAIRDLSGRYRLVVISDTVFSPGWALKKMLAKYELADAFSGFVFSDEAGQAKPNPDLFHRAADLAGCAVEELVHLGDREAKDVVGPKGVGARSILITAAKDRGSGDTRADAICDDYSQLPRIIDGLNKG